MITYVYQTINQKPGEKPRYFEFSQSITDEPFTRHPETGEPIQRVVLGGFGVLAGKNPKSGSNSCCGSGSGCC